VLDFSLLRNLQCVIDLNSKVPNGAFQFGMAKQKLDGPQVLFSLVAQCRLGPSHAVRAIDCRIESDDGNPLVLDPSVLARRNMTTDSRSYLLVMA